MPGRGEARGAAHLGALVRADHLGHPPARRDAGPQLGRDEDKPRRDVSQRRRRVDGLIGKERVVGGERADADGHLQLRLLGTCQRKARVSWAGRAQPGRDALL